MQIVYVIECGEFCKIGVSANPMKRVATLQTGAPMPLTLRHAIEVPPGSASAIERFAHHALSDSRSSGEWFRVYPDHAAAVIADGIKAFRSNQIVRLEKLPSRRMTVSQECEEWERASKIDENRHGERDQDGWAPEGDAEQGDL